MRDRDPARYAGLGCRLAVGSIRGEIHQALSGTTFSSQAELDRALCNLDGSPNKSRLGANASLGVSLSFARAAARQKGVPLYSYFSDLIEGDIQQLPRLTINLFSGGKHAGGQIAAQDVLIIPSFALSIEDGLAMASAVYQAAVKLIEEQYHMRWLTADEGGLAPPVANTNEMLDLAVESIERAGLVPGADVHLGLDLASSHFYRDGRYHLDGKEINSELMIAEILSWTDRFPLVSIEDGLSEEDWEGWPKLREALGSGILTLGDDLLCTNPGRIRRAIGTNACNALLLKLNQIGLVSGALEAVQLARSAGWQVTISARSGETEDDWLADLAVGWSGDQTKIGSITQSERLAKYNRLLEIEQELRLPVNPWPVKGKRT